MAIINNSTDLISYKEVEITIPAGESVNYQNPYNFVRILNSTGTDTDLLFRFGSSSIETYMTVGLGLRFNDLLPSLTIRNISASSVTIKISEIRGDILDDRLTVTGTVNVQQSPYTNNTVSLETFDANGEISVDSSGSKKVLIQNNSSSSLFVFSNNTFEIQPNGTFEMDYSGTFKIYGTVGENASVGLFS